MDVIVFTHVRLFGECLERCFEPDGDIAVARVVHDEPGLRDVLDRLSVDLVLIDITQGFDCDKVRSLAGDYPGAVLLALGLPEQEADVVRCGRAGFAGYVPRDASFDTLRARMTDCVRGRLECPHEIAAGLLRALAHPQAAGAEAAPMAPSCAHLSPREIGVARLLRQGCSNKEIARTLNISIATVKHHVHSILEKLAVPGRAHLRCATSASTLPWTSDEVEPVNAPRYGKRA